MRVKKGTAFEIKVGKKKLRKNDKSSTSLSSFSEQRLHKLFRL
jgi:hypothetical protein